MDQKVKKLVLFPFDAVFDCKGTIFNLKIYKFNIQGIIAEVSEPSLSPHNEGKLQFKLPVDETPMNLNAVVIKTYSQFVGEKNPKKKHFIEVHFKKLTSANESIICDFQARVEEKIRKAKGLNIKKAQ